MTTGPDLAAELLAAEQATTAELLAYLAEEDARTADLLADVLATTDATLTGLLADLPAPWPESHTPPERNPER